MFFKVLESFCRTGEDSVRERHKSRATFDLSKQSSVAGIKKHLTEFFGLKELALKFGIAVLICNCSDYSVFPTVKRRISALLRNSSGKWK